MSSPLLFCRTLQSLLRDRGIEYALTSGMACVEYGLQQNTKDSDWIIRLADIAALVELLCDQERGVSGRNWRVSYRGLFGAPLDLEYLQGGWTSHVAIVEHPESPERHVDVFGRPPRIAEEALSHLSSGTASRSMVARMKKTDRPKDWPIVNGLALQDYYAGLPEAVFHLREPDILRLAWGRVPDGARDDMIAERPLLAHLERLDPCRLDRMLLIERTLWECINRERYRVYQRAWKDFYRDWQRDRVGEWPTSEPFFQQHRMVCAAVRQHCLPAAPLAALARRTELYDAGLNRARSLVAATDEELSMVAMPLGIILT
jgi:hypothetical protein